MIIPVVNAATGIVTTSLKKTLEAIPGKHSIVHYKRQLYLEHHTQYRKYCSLKLET
jgi:hypothetical protein